MKTTQYKICLALAAAMIGGGTAFAQSNGVPKPDEYAKFSSFVTDRNIFDPNRVQHSYNPIKPYKPPTNKTPPVVPSVQLVGTMSYEKGWFAFFNANTEEYQQALYAGGKIIGYTITDIVAEGVRLQSEDKQQEIAMEIGDGFQQDGGKWVFRKVNQISTVTGSSRSRGSTRSNGDFTRNRNGYRDRSGSSSGGSSTSESSTPATPPSAAEQNDILKALMQKREKENQ